MASPEEPPGGRLAALVERVLAYMDRPWKAAVGIVLVVLVGLGWAVWQERERLVDLFTPEGHTALDTGALPAVLADLIVQTHGDVAAVWSVDLGANAAHFEQGRRRGGGAWMFAPARVPAIVTTTDPRALVGLLGGDTVCDGLDNPQSLVMQRFLEEGMRRLCVTPIPPEGNLIGLLTFAWREPPSAAAEAAAIGVAEERARELVTRW